MESKQLLVVQYRTDQSRDHEQSCLHEEFEDYELEINFADAIEDELHTGMLEDKDAVILGGSGEFFLTKGHGEGVWLDNSFEFIDDAVDYDIPVLGICFGSQILTLHQGGKLTHHEDHHETGTHDIYLNNDAEQCDIFSKIPKRFKAQLGHKDTPIEAGSNMIPLAESDRAPIQAFKVKGEHVWGTLFHPELNFRRTRERLQMFPNYLPDDEPVVETMDKVEHDGLAAQVLHEFLDYSFSLDNSDK